MWLGALQVFLLYWNPSNPTTTSQCQHFDSREHQERIYYVYFYVLFYWTGMTMGLDWGLLHQTVACWRKTSSDELPALSNQPRLTTIWRLVIFPVHGAGLNR